jgi:hypothetical protein
MGLGINGYGSIDENGTLLIGVDTQYSTPYLWGVTVFYDPWDPWD